MGVCWKLAVKCYVLNLYKLSYKDMVVCRPGLELVFEFVDDSNMEEVLRIGGEKKVKVKMYSEGSIGICAYYNHEIVGYGWCKLKGASDLFFRIHKPYLCSFYVVPMFRGKFIYPALVTSLIQYVNMQYGFDDFYIACDSFNKSSANGIKKLGFQCVESSKFLRFMRVTLFKHCLK